MFFEERFFSLRSEEAEEQEPYSTEAIEDRRIDQKRDGSDSSTEATFFHRCWWNSDVRKGRVGPK